MWPDRYYSYSNEPSCDDSLYVHSEEDKQFFLKRLAKIGKDYTDRYMQNNWIEADEEGFTGWRWEKYKTTRYLVSAANRYKDVLVMGTRHSSPTMNIATTALGGFALLHEYSGKDHEQGFVDQFGTFYKREEAYLLAEQNDQIRFPEGNTSNRLFSEGLY